MKFTQSAQPLVSSRRIALLFVAALLCVAVACAGDRERSDAKTRDGAPSEVPDASVPSERDARPAEADGGGNGIMTAPGPARDAGAQSPDGPDASAPARADSSAPPQAGSAGCEPEFGDCQPVMTAKRCEFTRQQLTAAFQRGPTLTWNGKGYGGAWYDFDASATRFMALDEQAKPVAQPRTLDFSFYGAPGLHAAETTYDFAIAESYAVEFLRLQRSGGDILPNTRPQQREVAGGQSMPSQVQLVAADDGYAIVWRDGMAPAPGVTRVARISPDGSLRGMHVLGEGGEHHSPRAVWNGDGFGVAWSQVEGAQTRIRFRELDTSGVPKAGEALTLATIEDDRSYPELIWTGDHYALAWLSGSLAAQQGKTHVVRLARGGERVGAAIEVAGYPAGLAWIDDGFAVLTYTNARGWDLVQIITGLGFATEPATVQLTLWNADLTPAATTGFKLDMPVNEFGRPLVWNGRSLTFLWGAERQVHVGQFSCK